MDSQLCWSVMSKQNPGITLFITMANPLSNAAHTIHSSTTIWNASFHSLLQHIPKHQACHPFDYASSIGISGRQHSSPRRLLTGRRQSRSWHTIAVGFLQSLIEFLLARRPARQRHGHGLGLGLTLTVAVGVAVRVAVAVAVAVTLAVAVALAVALAVAVKEAVAVALAVAVGVGGSSGKQHSFPLRPLFRIQLLTTQFSEKRWLKRRHCWFVFLVLPGPTLHLQGQLMLAEATATSRAIRKRNFIFGLLRWYELARGCWPCWAWTRPSTLLNTVQAWKRTGSRLLRIEPSSNVSISNHVSLHHQWVTH